MHGYARSVEIQFQASNLDRAGVVIDFSSMKSIKALLEMQFDHTVLVAQDDPLREEFERLASLGAANLRVMEDTSLEGSARWIHDAVTPIVEVETSGRVRISRIEVRESAKNTVLLSLGP
ncbi:6-pyruvoyl trahydropterin synthase family protein [Mycolicibacterium doricum]|uniref:6-pyruvoyl trahydropterin synthase family protein n=1 Tax=Mycolicibacterium doricum TaxID=126673 RepID=UPI00385008AA